MENYKESLKKYCIKSNKMQNGGIGDWFKNIFGFTEMSLQNSAEDSYKTTKNIFEKMYSDGNGKSINKILVGNFSTASNFDLNRCAPNTGKDGKVTLINTVDDILKIHANPLSNKSTIQVASQLNCLEMADQSLTPEEGITIYINDNTQGPKCAISAPAGLAYRNYLYMGGQTETKQIDMSKDLLNFLKTLDKEINWNVENGYLMPNDDNALRRINIQLIKDSQLRKEARGKILAGSHQNQGVVVDGEILDNHVINHVYCSGLPISYALHIQHTDLWKGIAEIFLEAMYENTLLLACYNNSLSGESKPCYLTSIGGGVFRMDANQIRRAIERACHVVAKRGLNLDVIYVHYGSVMNEYSKIQTSYPLTNVTIDSIWDDDTWVQKCCI
jgi:hypothetical protein